jgi:hypothetical protein
MRRLRYLLAATSLLALPACNPQKPIVDQKDGIKDALDSRPNEGLRDAGEDVQDAVKDVGKGVKDAVD